MADDRHYVGGDYYQLCDLSGRKIRASASRKIPGGQTGNLIVAPEYWEAQQPQDLVRGVVDDQTVAQPRPRQKNNFVILGTWVTEFTPRQGFYITVDSTVGFTIGHRLSVMLDSGETYMPVLISIAGAVMRVSPVLPYSVGGPYSSSGMVGNYGDPLENMILDGAPSGLTWITDDFGNPITDDFGNVIFAS